MAGLRFASLLVLMTVLLNLPVIFASSEDDRDFHTTPHSLGGKDHTTIMASDITLINNKIELARSSFSMVPANLTTFQVTIQTVPLAPTTLATFGVPGATIASWTPPPIVLSTSTSRTEAAKRPHIEMITTTITPPATPVTTDDVTGDPAPGLWPNSFTTKGKRDVTSSSALPCVTTLATYGLPGASLIDWTPPAQNCPTTFSTATISNTT